MKAYKRIFFFAVVMILLSSVAGIRLQDDRSRQASWLEPAGIASAQDEAVKEEGEKTTEGEESPCPECPQCPDAAQVVLRGLEDKRVSIQKQMDTLKEEKKELERYEEQLDEKLNALTAMKEQIKNDLALLEKKKTQKELDREAAYEAKLGRLVKMYSGMKPKDAAEIVNKMNLEVAMAIFSRMREASASQILSFVDSEKAAKISERLAFKRQ